MRLPFVVAFYAEAPREETRNPPCLKRLRVSVVCVGLEALVQEALVKRMKELWVFLKIYWVFFTHKYLTKA